MDDLQRGEPTTNQSVVCVGHIWPIFNQLKLTQKNHLAASTEAVQLFISHVSLHLLQLMERTPRVLDLVHMCVRDLGATTGNI